MIIQACTEEWKAQRIYSEIFKFKNLMIYKNGVKIDMPEQ
jgi:hypothetical protein